MAKDKKSFIFYSDWIDTFKELPKDKGYDLLMHILAYVNDEDPETDDFVISAIFAQMKNVLKRDLKKWEDQRIQRSEAGKRSAEVRKAKINDRSTTVNEKTRKPTVSDNVNVSVNDNVNVINKEKKKLKISTPPIKKRKKDFEELVRITAAEERPNYQFAQELHKFTDYWTEHGINDKKMRFEKEKSFGIPRRLDTWFANAKKFNKEKTKLQIDQSDFTNSPTVGWDKE